MFKANFRSKVLVPVMVVMALLVVVNRRITGQLLADAKNNLATANAVFLNLQQIHQRNLLSRFGNLPNQPLYRSLFYVGHDSPTLRKNLADFLNERGVDIVFYSTNSAGIIATEKRDAAVSAAAFQTAAAARVARALQGEDAVGAIGLEGRLYDAVSIPVNIDGNVIGALTIGSEMGNADALEFSQLTRAQIALLVGGRVAAATLPGAGAQRQFVDLFQRSLPATGDAILNVKQVAVDGIHYFGIAGRLESVNTGDAPGYVLLNSYEDSFRALQATQQLLLLVSLCAILIGAAVVWLLVSRVTQPLRELRDSAEAVGRGDLSRRVPVRSADECGELAVAFNRMTENVQQSRAQLEQTVTTLKTTQEQLVQSEKLSAVGEFVAGVAHELNNPLTAVMGFSEMLSKADVDPKYRRQLDLIFKAAQRCQKIVQSLLSFARRHPPERRAVSMSGLVEAVLDLVAYPLRTGNIEVKLQLDPSLPPVLADAHQIQQVLLNIINNARQAIEAHQPSGRITITTELRGPNVQLTIQDDGPGISEENLRRIFDPFFTTKEVGKGTGLGLSLCYGIIKEHGGSITPSSRRGEGATFIIELPVAHGEPGVLKTSRPTAPNPFEPNEGAGKKILVIDDEEAILQMVHQVLTGHGYHVRTYATGEAALRELEANHCDAVLCDWKMPGLNGRQIYEQLRVTNPSLSRRVIFITGDVINEPMQQFLELEKRPCLTKPFALTELRNALNTVLAAR